VGGGWKGGRGSVTCVQSSTWLKTKVKGAVKGKGAAWFFALSSAIVYAPSSKRGEPKGYKDIARKRFLLI